MSFPARITGVKSRESERRNSSIGGTGKVPNAKKPRSRPPTSLRDKLGFLQGHLPPYSGPYNVGCMEIEVPVQSPRTFSNITRHGHHLLQLETVLFTLYYPAAIGSGSGRDPAGHKKWSRETWLPRPRVELAKGYGKFAGIPDALSIAWFASTTMLTKLRAFRNSPPARHWPPEESSKKSGYRHKDKQGPPPPGEPDEPQFPLLFFSHGLGGNRTAYSSMCGEFASYGFVVCALEHRDGSGPRTFVNHPKNWDKSPQAQEKFGKVDHSEEELRKGYDTIDYIFPKGNPKDTSPLNDRGIDAELRLAQIEMRLAEFEEAYRVLCEICDGNGEEIARQNLRGSGYIGGSSRGLDGVDWSAWINRFHTDKVTAAGHSFGAATVVEALRHADRFKHVQAGIIYDIWGAPIKPPEDERHRIHTPLLGINSEAFMYWQSNFDKVMSLMEEAKEQGVPAFLCTVRGSIHVSQSDFSLLYRHTCSFFLKATVHPERAIDLNISASLEFLRDVTSGAGKSIIERCLTDEKLLQADLLERIPSANKPKDEFIAQRLKVKHEVRTRLAAKLQRKIKRKKKHGLYNPGDEVWMHVKPELDELRNWRRKMDCADSMNEEELQEETVETSSESGTPGQTSDEDKNDGLQTGSKEATDKNWLGHPPLLQEQAVEGTRDNSDMPSNGKAS